MLAEQVRTRREKIGLSQRDLAIKIGVSREIMRRIENGTQNNPKLNTLKRLAKTFNCTIEELIK